jgi:hypothetical protein
MIQKYMEAKSVKVTLPYVIIINKEGYEIAVGVCVWGGLRHMHTNSHESFHGR